MFVAVRKVETNQRIYFDVDRLEIYNDCLFYWQMTWLYILSPVVLNMIKGHSNNEGSIYEYGCLQSCIDLYNHHTYFVVLTTLNVKKKIVGVIYTQCEFDHTTLPI